MPVPHPEGSEVRVWDIVVRLFHWSLVLCIATAWISSDDANTLHTTVGYIAAALVLFRILWGFVGTKYARFSEFVRSPWAVVRYLQAIFAHRAARHLGHNPTGGAMILVLLLTIVATAVSGWMLNSDTFWGVSWVQELHGFLANGLILLVFLHVMGVLAASIQHRENLLWAMLTGRKRRAAPGDID